MEKKKYIKESFFCLIVAIFILPSCSSTIHQISKVSADNIGDTHSQYVVGTNYLRGEGGVAVDYVEAGKWLRKAADKGYAPAQNNLGYMYFNGFGFNKNYFEARKWWELAAKQETHWYSTVPNKEGVRLARNNLVILNQQLQGMQSPRIPTMHEVAKEVVEAEVKNDNATMIGNRVIWAYDLEGTVEKPVKVYLLIMVEGGIYYGKDLHLDGDIGNVIPGKGKEFRWNVLQDFPQGLDAQVDWELSAEVAR